MRRLAACALLALGLPVSAFAATGAHVRSLATRAETSSSALAELRSIRTVDGHAADLAAALDTTNHADLDARLHALAGGEPSVDTSDARAAAAAIVHSRRFQGSSVPRPLHGALAWLGRQVAPVGRLFHRIARHLPFGNLGLGVLLGLIVITAAGLLAMRVARRRTADTVQHAHEAMRARLDLDALEREADQAELAGDPSLALRLRYQAGLVRLGRARVVPLRESLTTSEARRAIALPTFDRIARVHDEVAYGGRSAGLQDAEEARAGWREVLRAKGVRG